MSERLSALETSGLVDALEAVLDSGAVVAGDVVISLAGVDLIYLNLRALLASMETVDEQRRLILEQREERS